ncbi:hypothetical protein GCM10027612_40950 [Microbispora bryophytorum subsp. camponoti]
MFWSHPNPWAKTTGRPSGRPVIRTLLRTITLMTRKRTNQSLWQVISGGRVRSGVRGRRPRPGLRDAKALFDPDRGGMAAFTRSAPAGRRRSRSAATGARGDGPTGRTHRRPKRREG